MGAPATSAQAQERMGNLHAYLMTNVEADLTHIYQLGDADAYRGRADGTKYIWRPIGGPARGPHPAAG
eukprot:4506164-Pyramimonas_sp.AAC.2